MLLQKLPLYFAYPSIFKVTVSFPCAVRKISFYRMLRLLSAEKVTPTLLQSLPSSHLSCVLSAKATHA